MTCPADERPDFALCRRCEQCALENALRSKSNESPKARHFIAVGLFLLAADILEYVEDRRSA